MITGKQHFKSSDGLKLCGILSVPEEDTNKCVILCHGITVDKDEDGIYVELARLLTENGYAVFRFDFRGHGESEGDSRDMTVRGEEKDLQAAVEFMQNKGFGEFAIIAASFAGGATSLYTASHQDIIKALILWNAVLDYAPLIHGSKTPWYEKYWGSPAIKKAEDQGYTKIGSGGFEVGKALIDEIKTIDLSQHLLKIEIPVLFVHGDRDTHVPYEDSVKYSKLVKKGTLITITGAEHGFHDNKEDADRADRATLDFLLKNF